MKILYITTIGETMCFFKYIVKMLLEAGNKVDIASNINDSPVPKCYNEWGCEIYPLSCTRSPLEKGNIRAVQEIRKLVKDNGYDMVHCHTPIASICARIACRKMKRFGSKMFYTAHGFHFYKGSPLKNWLVYYPIEWICSYWTDVLITINKEDFVLAQKRMKAKRVEYVPGIGIDINKFQKIYVDKRKKRKEMDIPEDVTLLLSVGELNSNKNHEVVIRALSEISNKNIHYAIAGKGKLERYLINLAKELGLEEQVHMLGFRTDVAELYKIADVYIHPSLREGLPVSIMEAMAAKVPVICSNIRGCNDLIREEYLFNPKDLNSVIEQVEKVILYDTYIKAIEKNYVILQKFDLTQVKNRMFEIYFSDMV